MIKSAVTNQEYIWQQGEYDYPAAYGFVPNIHTYLHEDEEERPGIIVVPGGGYCMVVNVEGEPVAETFYHMGMNVVVLTYTTDITMSVPLMDQPLKDLSRAIRYVRANEKRFRIDPNRLAICGFSAGGHLCATLCTHYGDVTDCDASLNAISNRPDGVILSYPVITAGEYTHIYSIRALLGNEPSKELLDYYSLEKQAHKEMPPCFIWQTVTDDLVPIENSMLFAEACRRSGVPYAYYAFPAGGHGLSVASDRIRRGDFGEPYTFDQVNRAVEAAKNRTAINVSEARRRELMLQFFGNEDGERKEQAAPAKDEEKHAAYVPPRYEDAEQWPGLAKAWLGRIGILR